ncbi:MAG: glycosyltransferase [Lachnospiraceae bacterium]|nr:glycosyltransferase [Lachnospiraceae bacterium]
MKVLILTCNTGGGHNTAAASIEEAFERRGDVCEIEDALEFISEKISKMFGKGHSRMYRYMPSVFNHGYKLSEQIPGLLQENSGAYRFFALGSDKLSEYIVNGQYELVICTHVFSAMMLSHVLKERKLNIRTGFVATDYTCYPGIDASNLDWYFISDESQIKAYEEKGVSREKLVVTGIPVNRRFMEPTDKSLAKKREQILNGEKHLLMMCGSMGCGPMKELAEELAEKLPKDAVLTIICGTNESLYRKLERRFENDTRVRVLAYTRRIPELMDSADLYLTKAGGLSTSEALSKQLPMCFIQAVAGCEEYNQEYFVSHGMAVTGETTEELAELCAELLEDEVRLEQMKIRMKEESPGNAAKNIVDFLKNGEE